MKAHRTPRRMALCSHDSAQLYQVRIVRNESPWPVKMLAYQFPRQFQLDIGTIMPADRSEQVGGASMQHE
jgi:hypothetical protein